MSKFKYGDRIVAIKDSGSGLYKIGDVFTVVEANKHNNTYVSGVRIGGWSDVFTLLIENFRRVRPIKRLPTIKIHGTDDFCLTIAPSKAAEKKRKEHNDA